MLKNFALTVAGLMVALLVGSFIATQPAKADGDVCSMMSVVGSPSYYDWADYQVNSGNGEAVTRDGNDTVVLYALNLDLNYLVAKKVTVTVGDFQFTVKKSQFAEYVRFYGATVPYVTVTVKIAKGITQDCSLPVQSSDRFIRQCAMRYEATVTQPNKVFQSFWVPDQATALRSRNLDGSTYTKKSWVIVNNELNNKQKFSDTVTAIPLATGLVNELFVKYDFTSSVINPLTCPAVQMDSSMHVLGTVSGNVLQINALGVNYTRASADLIDLPR